MSRKPNSDPNNRGEDWQQFIRDTQDPEFMAILADNPAMRLNRKQARALGATNAQEVKDEVLAQAVEQDAKRKENDEFRAFTIGKWYHDTFAQLVPKWIHARMVKGKYGWAKFLGYSWGVEQGNSFEERADNKVPKMLPHSIAWIARKQFVFFGKPATLEILIKDKEGVERLADSRFKFIWGI